MRPGLRLVKTSSSALRLLTVVHDTHTCDPMTGLYSLVMKRSAASLLRDIEPAPHIRSRACGGGVELLDWETGQRHSLDHATARMWTLLLSTGSLAATLQSLILESDAPAAQIQRNLDAFVQHMTAQHFLRACTTTPAYS